MYGGNVVLGYLNAVFPCGFVIIHVKAPANPIDANLVIL